MHLFDMFCSVFLTLRQFMLAKDHAPPEAVSER
jgi:hypothetical protein